MLAKGRGNGTTPYRVVELLKEAVEKTSQSQVAQASGLTRLTVQRYLRGVGEPSGETLQKLADFFGVSVANLRGEDPKIPNWMTQFAEMLDIKVHHDVVLGRIIQALEARGELKNNDLHAKLGVAMGFSATFVGQVLNGKKSLTQRFVEDISEYLDVSVGWLMGGTCLSYNEIEPIFLIGPPKGITQLVIEAAESAFEKRGIEIPSEEGKSRDRFLDFVKDVVRHEGEYWKVCHIDWDLLSLAEIETVIAKLSAIRSRLTEVSERSGNSPVAAEINDAKKNKGGWGKKP